MVSNRYFTFVCELKQDEKLKEFGNSSLIKYLQYEKKENQCAGFFLTFSETTHVKLNAFGLKEFHFTTFLGDPYVHYKAAQDNQSMIVQGKFPPKYTSPNNHLEKKKRRNKYTMMVQRRAQEIKNEFIKKRNIHEYLSNHPDVPVKYKNNAPPPYRQNHSATSDFDVNHYYFM